MQQDEAGDSHPDFSSSPGSAEEGEAPAVEQEPKLLWYMHDYSQTHSAPPLLIDDTLGVGEPAFSYSYPVPPLPPSAPLADALSASDSVGAYDTHLLNTPPDPSFFDSSLYLSSASSSHDLADLDPDLWASPDMTAFQQLADTSAPLTPSDPNYQHELARQNADVGLQQGLSAPLHYMSPADAVEKWHSGSGEGVGAWYAE